MRDRLFVVGAVVALLSIAPGAQTPAPSPSGTGSRFLDQVGASLDDAAFPARAFVGFSVDDPLCRRSVFNVLEGRASTAELLGSTLEKRLRLHLLAEIEPDVLAACWADLNCTADEGILRRLAVRRAERFKEVSLPALWIIANTKYPNESDPSGVMHRDSDRPRRYAIDSIRTVFSASSAKALTLDRLREIGEEGLVTLLEKSH